MDHTEVPVAGLSKKLVSGPPYLKYYKLLLRFKEVRGLLKLNALGMVLI